MSYILVKVTIPHTTGLPEDGASNSFAIRPVGGDRMSASTAFTTALKVFYDNLGSLKSAQYSWQTAEVEYIDLLDAVPRTPYRTQSLGLATVPSTGFDMPAEVSLCVSYEGLPESGANQRRRRGRVYVGPLQMIAPGADSPRASDATCSQLANAFADLASNAAFGLYIYSRYTHHAVPVGRNIGEKDANGNLIFPEVPDALPSSFTPYATCWVDNAWDTQRRRGPKATNRFYGVG